MQNFRWKIYWETAKYWRCYSNGFLGKKESCQKEQDSEVHWGQKRRAKSAIGWTHLGLSIRFRGRPRIPTSKMQPPKISGFVACQETKRHRRQSGLFASVIATIANVSTVTIFLMKCQIQPNLFRIRRASPGWMNLEDTIIVKKTRSVAQCRNILELFYWSIIQTLNQIPTPHRRRHPTFPSLISLTNLRTEIGKAGPRLFEKKKDASQ